VAHVRPWLAERRVLPAAELGSAPADTQVAVAGLVTHRQRPPTARGVVFISLEDETGLVNVICPPHVWERHRRTATEAPALLIHGRVERTGGAVNLVAAALRPLRVTAAVPSRDFR
jgi:error-prone DNA polymerase